MKNKKQRRMIPRYVERAMLRMMDDPELVRVIGKLMPTATEEVGIRLFNLSCMNRADSIRRRMAQERKQDAIHRKRK